MITINGQQVPIKDGQTVLDAAREAGIFIPTLCTHSELEPFGACRLCIVKIEGMRGYPTACTTPVRDEMVVTTEDEELTKLRRNVLEMMLSEHPNSCIICKDKEECQACHFGPTKAGRTTGCTFCSKKETCEIREISDYLGLKELRLPFLYKNLPVERDDPFFDRDYNLCVLCGRCVRVCQDIRGMGTIAFTQRSHRAKVGTAFNKSHMDSRCGFCGACVDVCPTGALSARGSKWYGDADSCTDRVCLLCGVGCSFGYESKWNRVVAAIPTDSGPTKGQACARGRFCVPTLVNGSDRLNQPQIRQDGRLVPVSWEEALEFTAAKLKEFKPQDIGILASPGLTNEGAYILQKFARAVLGTSNVDSTASDFLGPVVDSVVESGCACSKEGKIKSLEESSWVLILGNRLFLPSSALIPSVVRVKKKGAAIIQIGLDENLRGPPKIVDVNYTLKPKEILEVLYGLLQNIVKSSPEAAGEFENHGEFSESLTNVGGGAAGELSGIVDEISKYLQSGKGTIILGDDALGISNSEGIVRAALNVLLLTKNPDGLIPLLEGNAQGTADMGAVTKYLPGYTLVSDVEGQKRFSELWGVKLPSEDGKDINQMVGGDVKALYLTEDIQLDVPDNIEFLILQDIYPGSLSEKADVILPSCTFTEEEGTATSLERRIQKTRRAVDPPGEAMADWKIMCALAEKMQASGFKYEGSGQVQDEIKKAVPFMAEEGVWEFPDSKLKLLTLAAGDVQELPPLKPRFRYRGADIVERVEDFRLLVKGGD